MHRELLQDEEPNVFLIQLKNSVLQEIWYTKGTLEPMEYNLRKSIVLCLKLPGLSHNFQFLAILHETLHFSQKCLIDRLLLSTENIFLKRGNFIFRLIFSDQVSDSWDFQKIHESFFIWIFFFRLFKQRTTKTKLQTETIFRMCFLSFSLFFKKSFGGAAIIL